MRFSSAPASPNATAGSCLHRRGTQQIVAPPLRDGFALLPVGIGSGFRSRLATLQRTSAASQGVSGSPPRACGKAGALAVARPARYGPDMVRAPIIARTAPERWMRG